MLALIGTFAFEYLDPALQRSPFEILRLGLLLLGGSVIFLVMWLDDVRELLQLSEFDRPATPDRLGPFLWDHTRRPDLLGELTEARGIILTAFKFPFVQKINLWDISPSGGDPSQRSSGSAG